MKILLIDDHLLIREALRGVLHELQPAAGILEAADWRQAARELEQHADLDLVLLDLTLPDRNGLDILAELRGQRSSLAVVVLSANSDRGSVSRALELGAVGFIPKSASREVLLGAFRLIFSGGMYIPPEILPGHAPAQAVAPTPAALPAHPPDLGLTERQLDVLALMMEGRSNKAICRSLNLAEPTVKNHVTAILKALKAANRTEAVIAAGALGFTPQARGR
jgi:DNA-binding NarL/FixJ family response regulator